MMTIADETPRIWIGCYACYNAGELKGAWIDADADAVTEFVTSHRAKFDDPIYGPHEEYGAFDYEFTGATGEDIQEHLDAVERLQEWDDLREVVPFEVIRVASADGVGPDDYYGAYESDTELAYSYVDSVYSDDQLGPLSSYIDFHRFGRDLAMDLRVYRQDGMSYYFD